MYYIGPTKSEKIEDKKNMLTIYKKWLKKWKKDGNIENVNKAKNAIKNKKNEIKLLKRED